MSILDEIANPQVPDYLKGIKVVNDIETQKIQRRLAEVQTGRYLQQIMQANQAQQWKQQGANVIQQFLNKQNTANTQPPTQANAQPPAQRYAPTTANLQTETSTPGTTYSPDTGFTQGETKPLPENVVKDVVAPYTNIPLDLMKQSGDLNQLSMELAAIPGNQDKAQFFHNLATQAYDHAVSQTKEQRLQSNSMMERMGNAFYDIAKLDQQGKSEEAKALFNQTRDRMLTDPTFSKDPEVQQFFKLFDKYSPGLGQYIYTTTMYGQKGRDQFLRDQAAVSKTKTYKEATPDGYVGIYSGETGHLLSYLTDENGSKIRSWDWYKEQKIQGRSEARITLAEKAQEFQKTKLDITTTDKMLKYKNQLDKNLLKMKGNIERAFALYNSGKDFPVVDKLLQESVSNFESTSVRAYAQFREYGNVGDLYTRIANNLSKYFQGKLSNETRNMFIDTAKTLLHQYIDPSLTQSGNYWRRLAGERNLDPDQIVPYQTIQEVGQDLKNGIISEKMANEIIQKSRFKGQLEKWQQTNQP